MIAVEAKITSIQIKPGLRHYWLCLIDGKGADRKESDIYATKAEADKAAEIQNKKDAKYLRAEKIRYIKYLKEEIQNTEKELDNEDA
jgi:hypothetical protein